MGKLIIFIDPTREKVGISPTNGSPKVGGEIRLRPVKLLDDAGEAKITKTDFAVRIDQYVRLVTRAVGQLLARSKERVYDSPL